MEGSIEVASVDKSNTKMLNRDIQDNEVDIYNVESHKGLKGTIDTRMLTEKGRAEIADDVKKAKVGFYDVAKDIMTTEELTLLDVFSHQGYKVDFYDGMQQALKENKNGIRDILSDPNATKEQKNAAMQQIANSINAQLGVKTGNSVAVTATDAKTKKGEEIKGALHKESGDIVLNDKNLDNTGEAVNALGHELGHTVGYEEDASDVMGESLEDYANFGMWNYGDGETLADSNTHNGTVDANGNTIKSTGKAYDNFVERHDDGALDYKVTLAEKGIGNGSSQGNGATAKGLNTLSAVGGHTWLILKPDNPDEVLKARPDIKLDSTGAVVVRAGPDNNFVKTNSGNLEGVIGKGNSTTEYRQSYVIDTPSQYKSEEGSSADTQFILEIFDAADSYKNDLPYHGTVGEYADKLPAGTGRFNYEVVHFTVESAPQGDIRFCRKQPFSRVTQTIL